MSYKERAQECIDYLKEFHDEEDYDVSIFQGMLYFEFETADDAIRLSSAILAELSDSGLDIEDLIVTLHMDKMRLTIAGL